MAWDIEHAIKTMKRFDFIAEFVQRSTAKVDGRRVVDGFQVIKKPQGWTYRNKGVDADLMHPATADKLYDAIRRTPLNYYVRKAEELREEMLTKKPAQSNVRRDVVATLLKVGRRDLAVKAAWSLAAVRPSLAGKTIWGPESQAHFFRDFIKLQQLPIGKTLGVQMSVIEMGVSDDMWPQVDQFAKEAKTASWKRLSGLLISMYNDAKNRGDDIHFSIKKQKAVRAPKSQSRDLPDPYENGKKVYVDLDRDRGESVTISDLKDRTNEPRCFTQGPRAYAMAIKTLDKWKDMDFRGIMKFWSDNKIKNHYYLGMD